ncbi:hypothetical protein M422DRAFT_243021 [Sphaerobolus stellatus SS14]|nr:hypothetical protein M422DRAFT_243021 [Sphaerobolus stellatus SS14]
MSSAFKVEVLQEQNKLDLEDEAWQADNPEELFQMTADDFPDEKPCTSDEQKLLDAAELITRNHITDRTQTGHLQIIQAFVKFMLEKNSKWVAEVTPQSPQDV